MKSTRPRVLVVAALLVRGDQILLARRRADQAHPLAWELPGGKIEPGESPEEALARELGEELGVTVEIGRVWDVLFHRYPASDVLMLVYVCRLHPGQVPRCREVEDLAWARADQLATFDILPADAPLLARLTRDGVPAFL